MTPRQRLSHLKPFSLLATLGSGVFGITMALSAVNLWWFTFFASLLGLLAVFAADLYIMGCFLKELEALVAQDALQSQFDVTKVEEDNA